MSFTISYDRTTKIVTVFALLVQITAIVIFINLAIENSMGKVIFLAIAFMLAVLFFSIAFAPKSYEIVDGMLLINRLMMPPVKINLHEIVQATDITKEDLKGSFRIFGSGGFLGYYGRFTNKKYGSMTWYATDLKKAILIRTESSKKYILSPNERETFLNAVGDRIKTALKFVG